jgi:hypothetical protein
MIRAVRSFADFWVGFVVGDDWVVAAMLGVAIIGSRLLVLGGLPAWWLLPVVVLVATALSLRRTASRTGRAGPDGEAPG